MPRLRIIAKTPKFGRGKAAVPSLRHSPYYWLWRYLKAAPTYGPSSPAYSLFGDPGDEFKGWWRSHEQVFAEPPMPFTMADVTDLSTLSTLDLNDYMVVAVGLDVSKRTTVRTFRRILDKRKKGLKGGKVFERSKARFKFYTTPVCSALETTLKVYELKQQGGKTLWEIGEQANASPMQNVRKDDTKKVAGGKKHKMTVIVRRYLAHANAYLANVVLGLFPKK